MDIVGPRAGVPPRNRGEMNPWIYLDAAMSTLSSCMYTDDMSVEDQLGCLAKENDRRAAFRDRLIQDEAIRMHTVARDLHRMDWRQHSHVCNKVCGVRQLDVALYEKDGVAHVCATSMNIPCPMTPEFHTEYLIGYARSKCTTSIYVCPKSGSFHVCNESCDQCYMSIEGQKVCPLTAVVLGLDQNSDSIDWVHDAVDRGDFASAPVSSGGNRGGVKRKHKEVRTRETTAVHFASKHTDSTKAALVTLYMNAKRIRDTRETGENMVSEIQAALRDIYAVVYSVLVKLFPGCDGRRELDVDTRSAQFLTMISTCRKYQKDAAARNEPICLERLSMRMAHDVGVTVLDPPYAYHRTPGPDDARSMAGMYTKRVVDMLSVLVCHTNYGDAPICIESFTIAAIFIMRNSYICDGVEIISQDDRLAVSLPKVGVLTRLLGTDPSITASKACIHNAFRRAIDKGVNPVEMCAPPHDLAYDELYTTEDQYESDGDDGYG